MYWVELGEQASGKSRRVNVVTYYESGFQLSDGDCWWGQIRSFGDILAGLCVSILSVVLSYVCFYPYWWTRMVFELLCFAHTALSIYLQRD